MGREMISYNPRKFVTDEKISIIGLNYKNDKKEYHISNPITIIIASGLRELEWKVNRERNALSDDAIIRLLTKICNLEEFAIYIKEDDYISDCYIEFTEKKDIVDLIGYALDWDNPHGISIYREKI